MPEGNERLAKLEARVDGIEHGFEKHEEDCTAFRHDIRESIGNIRTTLAKNYWMGIVAMAGVVAIVQILVQRALEGK